MFDIVSGIFDTISKIGDAIVWFFQFIVGIVKDIAYVIELTGTALLHLDDWFYAMPSIITSILAVFFTVAVLYKVLGRDN